jgi:hypothetical protein
VTATTSSGPANSSSQLLNAEPPGLYRDRLLPVRHSSYIWTRCTLDTERRKLTHRNWIRWVLSSGMWRRVVPLKARI